MQAHRSITAPDEEKYIYKVSQWKWEPDPTAPWWQRKFFHWIYLPFQNFALKYCNIPTAMEVTIESDEKSNIRRTFSWFEDVAVYEDEDRADRACLGERWCYRKMLCNQLHPPASTQTFGTIFPRKKNPRKWANPSFPLFAKSRNEEERQRKEAQRRERQLHEYVQELKQVLDR